MSSNPVETVEQPRENINPCQSPKPLLKPKPCVNVRLKNYSKCDVAQQLAVPSPYQSLVRANSNKQEIQHQEPPQQQNQQQQNQQTQQQQQQPQQPTQRTQQQQKEPQQQIKLQIQTQQQQQKKNKKHKLENQQRQLKVSPQQEGKLQRHQQPPAKPPGKPTGKPPGNPPGKSPGKPPGNPPGKPLLQQPLNCQPSLSLESRSSTPETPENAYERGRIILSTDGPIEDELSIEYTMFDSTKSTTSLLNKNRKDGENNCRNLTRAVVVLVVFNVLALLGIGAYFSFLFFSREKTSHQNFPGSKHPGFHLQAGNSTVSLSNGTVVTQSRRLVWISVLDSLYLNRQSYTMDGVTGRIRVNYTGLYVIYSNLAFQCLENGSSTTTGQTADLEYIQNMTLTNSMDPSENLEFVDARTIKCNLADASHNKSMICYNSRIVATAYIHGGTTLEVGFQPIEASIDGSKSYLGMYAI